MWRFVAIFIVVPCVLLAGAKEDIAAVIEQSTHPYDYYCTGPNGARFEMGEVTCLVNNSCTVSWMAKCDMSLNNPMWRKVRDGCPAASLLHRMENLQPGLNTLPVNAKITPAKS